MIETLNNWDTQLFYFINGHHCTVMDWAMWFISSRWCWLFVLVAMYSVVVYHYDRKQWWLPLVAIGLCFLLADRGSVMLFKDTFCRLRPCHALTDVHLFHEGCGGKYGFVSSHAANAFALATFFWLRYRKKENKLSFTTIKYELLKLYIWAIVLGYSRVYLGKHYPGDVLCGALFGVLVGWLVWLMIKKFEKYFHFSETKS